MRYTIRLQACNISLLLNFLRMLKNQHPTCKGHMVESHIHMDWSSWYNGWHHLQGLFTKILKSLASMFAQKGSSPQIDTQLCEDDLVSWNTDDYWTYEHCCGYMYVERLLVHTRISRSDTVSLCFTITKKGIEILPKATLLSSQSKTSSRTSKVTLRFSSMIWYDMISLFKEGDVITCYSFLTYGPLRQFTLPTMIHHRRQTTTPGTTCPTLCDKCAGSFMSHRIMNNLQLVFSYLLTPPVFLLQNNDKNTNSCYKNNGLLA